MAKYRRTSARLKALERLLRSKRPKSALETAAIERQMRDLESGHRRGLLWDEEAAQRAVGFFGLLQHWKGKWAGLPIRLEPWQEHCVIAPLFGWKRKADGMRRFRTAYIEVPRKNGKTTVAAGMGLQGLMADHEEGAEVYAAATMRDQACILFNDAKRCLGAALKKLVEPFRWAISFPDLNATFRPLSADHDTLDGLNTSRAVIDELHAHKSRGLWDVLQDSVGARQQPLIVAITTAGADRQSICWEIHEIARQVLDGPGNMRDDFFAFISCADEEDDWQDPQVWAKANPNIDVSVRSEDLRDKCKDAQASGAAEANFRRKRLNQWVSGQSTWIPVTTWDAGKLKRKQIPDLAGRELFGGVDLGWRDDFACYGRVFPERIALEGAQTEETEEAQEIIDNLKRPMATARSKIIRAHVDLKVWIPAEGRRDIHKAPLRNWIKRGLVTVVPGNAVHPNVILNAILDDREKFELKEICIDPNNARQLGLDLVAEDVPTFEFWQSAKNYNEPCREFERLAAAGLISHDGNDLLRWMIGNVVMKLDTRGYVMPDKHKSSEKIDGPVSLLMAFARAMFTELDGGSVYDEEGVFVL